MLSQSFRAIFLLFTLSTFSVSAAILRAGHQVGCGPGVAAKDSFILTPDFGAGLYTVPVDDYLSDKTPGVVGDIHTSIGLATAVWNLKLSEFPGLTLQIERGGETLPRVGMIQRPEVLPHRLNSGFVMFPGGPDRVSLFTALPLQATPNDLSRLRHTIIHGMGLGVFCAVSDRSRPFNLFKYTSSTTYLQASPFQIDDDWRMAQSRRRSILEEMPRVHLRSAADLFASAFGREVARRSSIPTDDFDALMVLSGLKRAAARIQVELEDTAESPRERLLLNWGEQIIRASRLLMERPVADLETRITDIDAGLIAKINAVRVSKPDAQKLLEAQQGLKEYGQLLESRREEIVAERVRALDDLIIQGERPKIYTSD